jgi:Response regulator containing a CheY-like receiver domain and an HTH DNA-binding domain
MDKIRVMLVEDHVLVREGTKDLLEQEADLEVVAEAGDGIQAVELATKHRPDVIIMDIAIPKLNGIDATKRIKALHPAIAVLVLTAYDNDQYIFALLEAGAAGYLLKDIRMHDLVQAIRAVYSGESVLHPVVARKVMDHFVSRPETLGPATQDDLLLDRVTRRELEVLKLAAQGMTNREIANSLCISTRTVQVHLSNVFSKLGVGSRTEAVVCGLRRGWFTLDGTTPPASAAHEAV